MMGEGVVVGEGFPYMVCVRGGVGCGRLLHLGAWLALGSRRGFPPRRQDHNIFVWGLGKDRGGDGLIRRIFYVRW